MKIAKKALVVVVVAMMIASMSAMAFAAGESVAAVYDGSKNITVNAKNYIGLASFDFVITADDGITVANVKKSSDAGACDAAGNEWSALFNKDNGKWSGHFLENNWERSVWEAKADELGEELDSSFDPTNFNLGTIVISVASGTKGPAYVTITGKAKSADGAELEVNEKVLIVAGEDEDASKKAEEEASKKAEEEASKKAAEEASKKAEEEASKKAAEEAASKKAAEEAASKKAAEEAASKKAAEEAASKKAAEEASKKAAEEASKKAEEEANKGDDTSKKDEDTSKKDDTKKDDDTSKKDDTKKDDTKKNDNKTSTKTTTDGAPKTGDNMALAAAAGIVALAGAAFIITKKREDK